MKLKPNERLPCPFCGHKIIKLIGCPVTDLLGDNYADCYRPNCRAKAPQEIWNTRVQSSWVRCEDQMPEENVNLSDTTKVSELCIVLYDGFWPGRGNGGVTDLYIFKGDWFNYPKDSVKITHWARYPEHR